MKMKTAIQYTYQITYSNGDCTTEHDTEDDARNEIARTVGDDAVIHDEWQSCGHDGEERLLVWSCESDADNDDGAKAVASLRRSEA